MSGLVCPTCGSTFRAGFTRCASCKVDLVDADAFAAKSTAMGDPRKRLAGKKLVAVIHSSLTSCKEIEGVLLAAGIPCFLATEEATTEAIATKIGVMVAEEDAARVGVVMNSRFQALVKSEGVGTFRTDAIDVGAAEVECPACGHKGALKAGECADCGLFLGDPEA